LWHNAAREEPIMKACLKISIAVFASYVNVHTDLFTSGEIRGQVTE
jgi:hypothetical protein